MTNTQQRIYCFPTHFVKMERVSRSCGEYLISQLTPDNCLSVRSIPGIAADAALVERLDHYIQEQVSTSLKLI